MLSYILAVVCGLIIVCLDQTSKYYIISNFELGQTKEFLTGLIDIVYIHNEGAAWGVLSGKTALLVCFTLIALALCVMLCIKFGNKNKLLLWALTLVISGGIGNFIDRAFRDGKVIDFLHFEFWPTFPVFNVADCTIVIGVGLLILYFVIDIIKEKKGL